MHHNHTLTAGLNHSTTSSTVGEENDSNRARKDEKPLEFFSPRDPKIIAAKPFKDPVKVALVPATSTADTTSAAAAGGNTGVSTGVINAGVAGVDGGRPEGGVVTRSLAGLLTSTTPILLSADRPVEADVRGNLGPPSVVTNEKMEDWLTDRWQGESLFIYSFEGMFISGVPKICFFCFAVHLCTSTSIYAIC
jgi:hypothetical protein